MRCFVSLPIPPDVREHLDAFCDPRRDAEPTLSWSDPQRWHVTLAFMPDVAEWDVDALLERLGEAAARRTPPTLRLAGGGVFGGAASARVLWAGIDADEPTRTELDRLATGARNAAAIAGTEVEGGRFVPHVTLARARRPRDLTHLLEILDVYRGPAWTADEIHLVQSHLGERGARHEIVGTCRIGPEVEDTWWRRGIGANRDRGVTGS